MKTKKMLHQLNYKHIEREDYLLPSSLDKHNSSFIYGEVNPKHIVQIIKNLNHDCCNNFVDIGSGCGKLVIYVALEFPTKFCSGIEIHENRHQTAVALLEDYISVYGTTEFQCVDFMNVYFGNYDLLYCCNVIFSKEDNKKLYKKILTEFSGYAILFNYNYDLQHYLLNTISVDTSWERKVNIYVFYIP
jgi:tRNA G46 methylase TrmB